MPIIPRATTRAPLSRSALAAHEHRITSDAMGRNFRTIPSGVVAMGSRRYQNTKPHMVGVSSFDVAITPESEAFYRKIMGKPGNASATENKPVTCVSYRDAEQYFDRNNAQVSKSDHIGFLTEAEYEMAARGGVVNVRQLMEEQDLRNHTQLDEWLSTNGDPLENFIGALDLNLGNENILDPNPQSQAFKALIKGASNVYAWRRLRLLTVSEAQTAALRLHQRMDSEAFRIHRRLDAPDVSESHRLNAAGLSDMGSNVFSWTADVYRQDYEELNPQDPYNAPTPDSEQDNRGRVWRGNACSYDRSGSTAGRSGNNPVNGFFDVGLRVGRVPLP